MRATVADVPVCGHDAAVELLEEAGAGEVSPPARVVEGELLAATPEALAILEGNEVRVIRASAARRVLVRVAPGSGGRIAGLTVAGSLSTISNGGFLVFTLPLWVLTGVASGARAAADVSAAPPGHPGLPAWARFPQGLPPGWPGPGIVPERCRPSPTEQRMKPEIDPSSPSPPSQGVPSEAPSTRFGDPRMPG